MENRSSTILETQISILASLIQERSSKDDKIIPTLNPILGISYKIGEIDFSYEQIKDLEEKGLLQRIGLKSFVACPICSSIIVNLNLVCPNCKNQSLERKEFIIHYECNYIDEMSKFLKDEELTCPKCKKSLKKVGIDYGKPGKLYKCSSCGEISQYPLVVITCFNNHISKIDEAELISYPIYRISSSQLSSTTLEVIKILNQYFLQSYPNLKVESPKTIYLNPKEKYMIPLYISDTYTNKKIYIDFINNEKEFEEKALKLLKIALLDNAKIIVVINNYTIDPDLFDPKRIRLLNIYSKNIEEISKLLINEIEKILKQ